MQNIPLGCTRLSLEMEQCVTAFPRPYMQLQMEMPEDVYQCGMLGYLFACLFGHEKSLYSKVTLWSCDTCFMAYVGHRI